MTTQTRIELDGDLVKAAVKRSGAKTQRAAVEVALKAYLSRANFNRPDYAGLLALRGSGCIADDYDPKAPYGLRRAPAGLGDNESLSDT